MSKVESSNININDNLNAKSSKNNQLSFDEIAAIIQCGDGHKLKAIIESKQVQDINVRCSGYPPQTFLNLACLVGSAECAAVLLNNAANINEDTCHDSNLKYACQSGNLEMVRFVIQRGFKINDEAILYLFEVAKIASNPELSTILLEHVKDVNHQSSIYSTTFLIHACKAGNVTTARMLLERGAGRELVSFGGTETALRSASGRGHVEIVKLLLGWDKESGPIDEARIRSAMSSATVNGCISTLKLLVEYGTNVDALNTSLFETVHFKRVEIAEFLLDSGADFSAIRGDGRTPWICACERGGYDLVRLFLARGADPNYTDSSGECPLKAALFKPGCATLLLEHGADPNRPLPDGSTLLLYIVRPRNRHQYTLKSLTLLLGHGADPNLAHATTGETPLMAAAALHIDLVKLLLEYGADVTQVDREGKSVLDMLGRTGKYGEMVELCTQYIECNKPGAKVLLK